MSYEIDFDFACRDDCLSRMVPIDLRQIISERDRLRDLLSRVRDELFILDESEGIAGWHANGDTSPWDEGEFPNLRADIIKELQESGR